MMQEERIYVFADPFNSVTSGVTAYIREATHVLSARGWKSIVIGIKPSESIEAFRKRLAKEVHLLGKRIWMVEAPESLAASVGISSEFPIHIRLHLSRQVGKLLQGHRAEMRELRLEQREIARATYVSAPSQSAVALSRVAFRLPDFVIIYGNPLAILSWTTKQKRFESLFIGRWQSLKGVHLLHELAAYLKGKKIGVLTDRSIERTLPDEFQLVTADTVDAKRELIRESHCVMVPSLFETASMVGLEALSVGTPVVTWSHVGLTEYASSPMVCAVEPFDLGKFALALGEVAGLPRDQAGWNKRVVEINDGYLTVIRRMMHKTPFGGTFGLLPPPNTEWLKIIENHREGTMNKNERSGFSRKFRKLRRDPVAFFRDSWIADIFVPPGSKLNATLNAPSGTRIAVGPKQQNEEGGNQKGRVNILTQGEPPSIVSELLPALKDVGTQIILNEKTDNEIKKLSYVDPITLAVSEVAAVDSDTNVTAEPVDTDPEEQREKFFAPLFADIREDQRISFGNVENRRIGWRVGFFYSETDRDLAEELFRKMNEFEDFRPLRAENIYVGRFEISDCVSTLSLINKIDVANKAKISAVDHIILLNAPPNLQEALRVCGTRQRIIAIDTLGKGAEATTPDVDVLIRVATGKSVSGFKTLRKEIVVSDERLIVFAIRRAVQEGGPKSPDMLIPLVGGGEFNPNFFSFDSSRYQGVIEIDGQVDFQVESLEEFCDNFAESIKSMHILDSVYCQYRSLCEDVERGTGLAALLCAALKDGILFDVRH
ncbi:glycosyltransferase [Cupriavidus consociatus]|uniref:glycosyltransferase n=1 Tax=Cupriavidus consociatus TaxID=2821357 RepID=UPI001AEAA40A|nr:MULTISPECIES: glycosyltransferase [unclassified Cupriavidus]MBP0623916.1 glycosyltransferase [Cupriavidus sp. LEh25]MDK2660624.1 glycosyltransferase [Cupriavidus sp. LEh21]